MASAGHFGHRPRGIGAGREGSGPGALRRYLPPIGFEATFRHGDPPWDIGAPQPAVVRLAEHGVITGDVVDVGCGTGDNALYLAGRGLRVTGVDAAPTAIARARAKAGRANGGPTFIVADALALDDLGSTFDTALDCGLFHTFSDPDRIPFERSLHAVLRPGGRYILLGFSERQPGDYGPRRVTQAEIRSTFADGWTVDSIEPERFVSHLPGGAADAWLALLTRI
jgi:SAM-dependent methyltransferase